MKTIETEKNLLDIVSRSFADCTAERREDESVLTTNRRERMKKQGMVKAKKVVPVFFASDDNYIPFLAVAMHSLKKNASDRFNYRVYVLHSGLNGKDAETLMAMSEDGFEVHFVDVSEHIEKMKHCLCLRDYYTDAIYYRLFIVGLFPEYDKAVYLDSDTVILGDIADLYNADLGNNYIGAVTDQVVSSVPVFQDYTKKTLGIAGEKYFNSGVILMNLKKFREENFYDQFYKLLSAYPFRVAPDQDCLNVICKGKVKYFAKEWNKMPISGETSQPIKIVHYNLAEKPWHYEGIAHAEYFWEYAQETPFYDRILKHRSLFTEEMAKKDKLGGKNLIKLAIEETENPENYFKKYGKAKGKK